MFKTNRILLMAGLAFILGTNLYSEEKLILTLEKSINIALEQNPFHLASEEKVTAAESKVRESAAAFFPSLNSQGYATLSEKLFSLEFPSMIPGGPPQKLELDFTRDYQVSLALSIPIFTGGRLISGYKSAKYNLQSAQEGVRQSRHMTIFNTKRLFYGCLLAEEFVKVAEDAVDLAEKLHKNIRSQYEVGMASKFDLLRSEVQVANLRPQLIQARNSLNIMYLSLKNLLGIDQDTEIEIQGQLEYQDYSPELEKNLILAAQKRPEINQILFQKKMAVEMLKTIRASRLPSIAISGTYNFWSDKLNFNKDFWQDYYTVNLVFSLPIFNGLSISAQEAQAKAAIKELYLTTQGLEDSIEFEVRQSILKINEAKESLLSQEKNVEQAEESLRNANLSFDEGMVTILDVNQAQNALIQAKTNYSQALYDYMVAVAELNKAVGLEKIGETK